MGTFLLVFIGPGSVILASMLSLAPLDALAFVALVFGSTVGSVILLLGRYSGAHINPAVTIASVAGKRLHRVLLLPYLLSQVAGGLLAGLGLRLAFGTAGQAASLGATKLASGISPPEGVALEIIGTYVLAMAALTAGSRLKSPVTQAILVGGTLVLLILIIGPLTGASFNPARSLGPSLFSGYLSNQIVYYVGPVIGGACAGLTFEMVTRAGE